MTMSCIFIVFFFCASFLVHAHVMETPVDSRDATRSRNMLSTLMSRVSKTLPLHYQRHVDLHDTTLGKPKHLANPSIHPPANALPGSLGPRLGQQTTELSRSFLSFLSPDVTQTSSAVHANSNFHIGAADTMQGDKTQPRSGDSHWFEFLKFDGAPTFDVLERTKELVTNREKGVDDESIYSKDYVLRGPVIGPLTRKDLKETQAGFNLKTGFPDVALNPFGFALDPENPYRCFWFERWTATNTGPVQVGPLTLPATGNKYEGPTQAFSIVWNPEGKVIYESVGHTVERFEGTTKGAGAVFGLLQTAGLPLDSTVGSVSLSLQQRLGHAVPLGTGRAFSREEDIPNWWKSRSRGADATD